nr:nucleoporin-like protein amo1 [Penaeus vannamei]
MMYVLVIVALAAAAVGQQFQQQRQYDTAVRLATPGYFTQGGSFTSASFQNANGRLQGDSFQNSFQTATSDANTFRQSGLFQNSNQLQRNAATNRNQFQTGSFQQSSFDSNAFQQNTSPFQQNSNAQSANRFFQSGSSQFGSDNRFQTNANQINSGSRFQSANQQDNSFQTFDNQRNSASTFSTFNNQQNLGGQFQQRSSSGFQSGLITRFQQPIPVQPQQPEFQPFQSSFNNQNSNTDSSPPSTTKFQPIPVHLQQPGFHQPFLSELPGRFLPSIGSSFDSSVDSASGFEPLNLPSAQFLLGTSPPSAASTVPTATTLTNNFMCGEGSVFDQKELACVAESSAIPCQESSNYFYTNEQFGRPEDKSL